MINKIIFNNTIYQIASRFITSGVGLITTILIARHFGVAGYGQFTTITAYVGLFYLVADFGLNAIFLQKEQKEGDFKSLFYLRLALSLILVALSISFGLLFSFGKEGGLDNEKLIKNGIVLFSATIIGYGLLTTANAVFQKKLLYNLQLKATILGSLSTLFLVYFFTKLSLPFYLIIFAFVFGNLLTAFSALYLTKQNLLPVLIDKKFIKSLVKESFPLGLMLIFNLIYFRIDMIILSFFKSSEQVGIYGFSYRLFDFLIALPLFLSNSIYPSLLSSQKNYGNFFFLVKKYAFTFFISSIFVFIIAFALSPLIPFVKEEFKEAILPFRILTSSLPIFFLSSLLQWVIIAQKKQKLLLYVYSLAAVLNIFLNLIFIPIYGYMAALVITVASEAVVLTALIFVVINMQKKLEIFTL